MKKVIKARLILPEECYNILISKEKEVLAFFNTFKDLEYDIYLGELQEETVCVAEFVITNISRILVENDYKNIKKFLSSITGKKPSQNFMAKLDKIF